MFDVSGKSTPGTRRLVLGLGWKRLVLLALVVAVFVAVALWSRRRKENDLSGRAPDIADELVPSAMAVAPGIFLLGGLEPAAAYAVETSAGLVLIDSGVEADAASLRAQLVELGLDVNHLKAILLTHVHADHSSGAVHLRSLTGAKIYAGRGDAGVLREGRPRLALVSTFHMPDYRPQSIRVDVELEGQETIAFGETRFTVIAAPGHTAGSVCYLLERPGLRALFAGDVIMSLSANSVREDIRGPLGTYVTHLPPVYGGGAGDFLASLRRLRAMPVPDLVLPGHPRLDRIPQSPRLSSERWNALLSHGIRDMEQLLTRYKTDGANFLDGSPRELLPGLHYLGNVDGSVVCCLDAPKGLFVFDAPGGPALVDFLAASFKRLGWKGRKPSAVLLTSADQRATAGLKRLVEDAACRVVAPKASLAAVRSLCPVGTEVLTEEDLKARGWLDIQALPLEGRGLAPLAYRLQWDGKVVLVSGRIPVQPSNESAEDLLRDLGDDDARIEHYLRSLDRLKTVKPDLWLPAMPVHGQNANLYDQEWEKVLTLNERMIQGPHGR
jgi:glyoxylase-like metal-dependent hydrolase (beta-lactamase superfamily II)